MCGIGTYAGIVGQNSNFLKKLNSKFKMEPERFFVFQGLESRNPRRVFNASGCSKSGDSLCSGDRRQETGDRMDALRGWGMCNPPSKGNSREISHNNYIPLLYI